MTTASRTTTEVTHYHIQKKRRAEFIEEWRKYRQTVIASRTWRWWRPHAAPGSGVYMRLGRRPPDPLPGCPGARESTPASSPRSTAIPGTRWCSSSRAGAGPRSTACGSTGGLGRAAPPGVELAPLRQRRRRDRALHDLLRRADAGHDGHVGAGGRGPHAVRRAARRGPPFSAGDRRRRSLRPPRPQAGHASRRSAPQRPAAHQLGRAGDAATPRGTRTKFLLDRAIGYQASGITKVMIEIAPGQDAVDAPPPGRGVALRRRGRRATASSARRPRAASTTLEEGRPDRRRPLPVAPALQRRPGQAPPRWSASTCSTACWRRCAR